MAENTKIDRVKQYLQGEIIFQEGQPSQDFYILQKGEVEVSVKRHDKRHVINTLYPGDFFGEMGLISNEPRSATCKAITFVEVIRVNNEDFQKLLKQAHPLPGKIINLLLKRVKRLTEITVNNPASANTFYSVAALLELYFKVRINDGLLEEPLIRQITAVLGVLPHQVREVFQQLSDFSLIRIEKKLKDKSGRGQETENRIFLLADNLEAAAKKIQLTASKAFANSVSSELELMEIHQALDLYGIDQKKFYSKMSSADFPDDLFFINKPILLELVRNQGKQFFEKPTARNIADISRLDDLLFVDKKTIQLAMQEIEAYEMAKLIKYASSEIAEIFMNCLSTRMKGIIDSTISKVSIDDDLEMQELEKTFIDIIKRLKKPAT